MAQRMLEQFHSAQPDIQVFFTMDPDNLADAMIADFQAGTAPDVFDGCCDFFPAWAQQGYLLDLRPFVQADLDRQTIEDWDPAQVRALITADGRQFGLPKYHGALGLFYNKDLFDEQKLDYPDGSWTHDDYLQAMRRLTIDRDGDGKTDQWGSMLDIAWERIQVHVNGWGGHFVDPDNPRRSFMARPEALAAMDWIRERMWGDHVMASFLDVQNLTTRQAFIEQRLAMVEDGSWALKDILEGAHFRIGLAPFPAGPARRVTLATTDGFGIYAGTRHPEAAWELLKFLIGKDYGRAMAKTHLLQPARASLVEEWAAFVRQQYPQGARDLDVESFAEGQRKGYSVTAEIFANMASARQIVSPVWNSIFTLGQTPVEEMVQTSAAIEMAQPTG
jgi:multiple sugar transport system substrate-binding protein